MEIELNIDCNNCSGIYTMIYDSEDVQAREPSFHCAFCGILMESYYDELEE